MTAMPARVAGVREVIAVSPPGRRVTRRSSSPPATSPASTRSTASAARRRSPRWPAAPRRSRASTRSSGRGTSASRPPSAWCYGQVDIDSIAGPSEVLIVADGSAPTRARSPPTCWRRPSTTRMAAAVCVTPDRASRRRASRRRSTSSSRRCRAGALAARSLARFGAIVVTCVARRGHRAREPARARAPRAAGPSHRDAWLPRIHHAGAIFLGPHAPEAFGDYLAGPESRAADRRHGALRVAARRLRLRQAHQPDRGRAAHARAARAGGRRAWRGSKGSTRTRARSSADSRRSGAGAGGTLAGDPPRRGGSR